MITDIKAVVSPFTPDLYTVGTQQFVTQSRLGQLFTADWIHRLTLAGRVFHVPLGTLAATSHTGLTGNAAVNLDQPEVVVGIDSGVLIPLEIDINILLNDADAYDDLTQIVFYADRTNGLSSADESLGNEITVLNQLDGGEAFTGRATETVAADITDPVVADVIASFFHHLLQVAAEVGGVAPNSLNFHWDVAGKAPTFLRGPASIVGFVTGTNTPTYQGHLTVAHLPEQWIPTS